uniref:Neur_chan_LBD domain-containing protein n=1 Tax=Heligmosomoides polygyrus TaxID=6339 RepID=A0A183FJQ7_HELPZ
LHVPSDMIWRPDLLVYNNANMNIRENEMQTNVQIEHTGRISLFRALITDVTCDLRLERFPYDQQICYVLLASWSYDGSQIMLFTAEEPTAEPNTNRTNLAALNHYIPNMEWTLVDFKYRSNLKYYDCCPNPYPDISYFFAIKRNPSYYLFTLIIPSAFITIVTVIGFFTPHSSTGENTEKVSLGVTALLSLAIILMMVSDKLPATSNSVPLLGQYYIGLIFIMFLATYCTTFTLGLQMQGNTGQPISRRVRGFLLSIRVNKSSLLQWFFGKELMNTQETIKMRLKKYDKLSELKKTFARDFLNLQQKLLKTDEPRLSEEAARKIPDPLLHNIVIDVLEGVQSIRQEMLVQEHVKRIRREWQMLARMMEKLIMWVFIFCTIMFAAFMLYDQQDPPIITEEYMREKANA